MSQLNNQVAHRIARSAMLDDIKDQNALEESIYTELQIAEKRGEILAKYKTVTTLTADEARRLREFIATADDVASHFEQAHGHKHAGYSIMRASVADIKLGVKE